MIPYPGSNSTNFEFMYWIDGKETNPLIYMYNNIFGEKDKGIFISVGILTIFLLIFITILMANASATSITQVKKE